MRQTGNNQPSASHRRASIRVPRKAGETALKLLEQSGLIDHKSRVKVEAGMLVIPLGRQPLPKQIRTLQKLLGNVEVTDQEFDPKTRTAKTLEELLDDKFPSSLIANLPASFDVVGDIAVVEFSPQLAKYETLVADAILKMHKNVTSVYSKTGAVSGTERIRPLRHLAGEERTVTVHKEFGCRFKVDLAKVYFSPRLSTEHHRVAEMVSPGECVVDMFAGVGPFSILTAKMHGDVEVHAIDSNPEATRLVEENIRLNKPNGKITVWEGNARDIVANKLKGIATRVIMNLPSDAKTFIDVACTAFNPQGGILHYYTFADGLDYGEKAVTELRNALLSSKWKVSEVIGVRAVRGVAPMMWQVVVDARVAPAF